MYYKIYLNTKCACKSVHLYINGVTRVIEKGQARGPVFQTFKV